MQTKFVNEKVCRIVASSTTDTQIKRTCTVRSLRSFSSKILKYETQIGHEHVYTCIGHVM